MHIILALFACLLVGIISIVQKDAGMKTVSNMGVTLVFFLAFGLVIRKTVRHIMKGQESKNTDQETDETEPEDKKELDESKIVRNVEN